MAEVVIAVAVAISSLEGATHLEVVVIPMVADIMVLIRGPGNVNIGGIITSLRSVMRSLIALNGHNWLMLTLLPGWYYSY